MHIRELWIGMWMFMVFSVSTLRGQGPQLPPVPRVPISNANGIEVSPAVKQDESRALRSVSPLIVRATTANNEHFLGKPHPNPKSTSPDGAVQTASGPKVATADGLNFLGVGQDFVGPLGA